MHKKIIHTFILLGLMITLWCFSYTNAQQSVEDGNWACKTLAVDWKNVYPYEYSVQIAWGWTDNVSSCNITNITNLISSGSSSKREILEKYCMDVLSTDQLNGRLYFTTAENSKWNPTWDQTFDSKQSLFIYTLCYSFASWDTHPLVPSSYNLDISSILTWDIVKALRLQQKDKWKDSCDLKADPTLSDCDISTYSSEIFSALMSDIFKIKYAEVFQVEKSKPNNDENWVVATLSWYLHLNKTADVLQEDFPQTISVIKSNQKYHQSILWTLKLLNNDLLFNLAEKNKCPSTGNIIWANFIACGLHWTHGTNTVINISFLTLYYNEILNYRFFTAYYSNQLKKYAQKEIKNKNLEYGNILSKEYLDLWEHSELLLKASAQTLSDLQELFFTYPLHIWLLLYQEKILSFRNNYLSPITTSFYSLSERLQNVQEAR